MFKIRLKFIFCMIVDLSFMSLLIIGFFNKFKDAGVVECLVFVIALCLWSYFNHLNYYFYHLDKEEYYKIKTLREIERTFRLLK